MTIKLPRHAVGMQVFFVVSAVIYVLCQRFAQFWTTSTDAAQHYSLIARISQLFSLPAGVDPSLGEMNIYPAGSHTIAALLGYFVHSPFAGMHLTSLLAVMLLWGALIYMLLTLPRKAAVISIVGLLALLALNRQVFQAELFGREIAADYFFAQLVGYAVAISALAILQQMELAHTTRWQRHAFALLAIYFTTNLHLLPTIQLLGCYCLCQWLDVALYFRRRKAIRWRLLEALAISLLALTMVVKHPYFQAMKDIGQNNGSLNLHYFNDLSSIALLAVIVAVGSGALLLHWLKQETLSNGQSIYKYIASLGLVMALMCLLQEILLLQGNGSLYGVKKYVFGLTSIALLELSLGVLLLLQTYLPRWCRETLVRGQLHHIALPGGGILLCSLLILPSQGNYQSAEFIKAEQNIMQLAAVELTPSAGKYHYVAELAKLPPMANYMFSIGLLHTPRRPVKLPDMTAKNVQDYANFDRIITSNTSSLATKFDCRVRPDASGLTLLDGDCIRKALNIAPIERAKQIDFSDALSSGSCELQGLGDAEGFGRWTTLRKVSLRCPLPQNYTPKQIELEVVASFPASGKQLLKAKIAEGSAQEVWIDGGAPTKNITLSFPPNVGTHLELQLELPFAKSPLELGMSTDPRLLGVGVHRIRFK